MNINLGDLSIEQRLKLIEDIWDSIAADQAVLPIVDEQRAELDRRLNAFELDCEPGRPTADALLVIRKRL